MPCRRQTALALRGVQSRLETKSVVKADLSEPCDYHPRKQATQEGRRKRSVKAVVARTADQILGIEPRKLTTAASDAPRCSCRASGTPSGRDGWRQKQAQAWLLSEDCATVVAFTHSEPFQARLGAHDRPLSRRPRHAQPAAPAPTLAGEPGDVGRRGDAFRLRHGLPSVCHASG